MLVATAATAGIAYVLGTQIGGLYATRKAEQNFLKTRATETEIVLANSRDLAVGKNLPNAEFTALNGDTVMLYDLLVERTSVAFFSNTCPACIELARRVAYAADDVRDMECFVFITQKDPEELRSFCDDLGLRSAILIDEELGYTQQLFDDVVVPTAIIVDNSGVIEDIIVGGLTQDEIEDLMAHNTPR